MANNQNFSNLLLENIDNEIPITFELITPSKDATATTSLPTLSKSSMNHSPSKNANKLDSSNRVTMLLEDSIVFLKEETNQKDRVIDSLLNRLSKENELTPQNKTFNAKEKTISIQTEVTAYLKSIESSKQTKNGSTQKVQNENEKA